MEKETFYALSAMKTALNNGRDVYMFIQCRGIFESCIKVNDMYASLSNTSLALNNESIGFNLSDWAWNYSADKAPSGNTFYCFTSKRFDDVRIRIEIVNDENS